MKFIWKALNFLSSLKVAIFLLFLIAISSAIGTAIPQKEVSQFYLNKYQDNPWLGIINNELLLKLQLDHVYSSFWFLTLLFWLGLALIICSWKRQWPSLKKALTWIDYKKPDQLIKLAVSETISISNPSNAVKHLAEHLTKSGWKVKEKESRISARKGVIGRVGPPLVHLGLILLMLGATLGALKGQRVESFITQGRSIDLISPNEENQLSLALEKFNIERSPDGKPEQFISSLKLIDNALDDPIYKEISVNHPLRYNGLTIYQADWSLSSITIRIDNSPKFKLPLTLLPELGEQVWGVLLPDIDKEQGNILITLTSENGPIRAFNEKGKQIGITRPNAKPMQINNMNISLFEILPSSGILIKHDPGVPLVYMGFAITLLGSIMSIISTKLLWAIAKEDVQSLYIGGLSNRDLSGLVKEFPTFLKVVSTK